MDRYNHQDLELPRSQIPPDITAGIPDHPLWIAPTLTAGGDGLCDVSEHFQNHNMIFDTTFCGTFVTRSGQIHLATQKDGPDV
jgi:hypothetical protein